MKLFDLSLKLNGFPIKEAQKALKSIQKIADTDFETYVDQKKQDIVFYHITHNPFYKSFAKGANATDWNSIPIMTKRDLQQPLTNRLSEGFSNKNVYINKTSGSSGDPFVFAKDIFCHALTWAVAQNRFGWFNIDFNTSKQARFYGIPLNKKGYYKERIKDALSNRYRFSVFDLSDAALEACLKKFESTAFHYINGYTSSIVQFAKFLNRKNILLKKVCPSLKICVVTSEMLFDEDKSLMQTQFGVPVINEYGAAELGLIAFENTKGKLAINNDDLFVEILDDDDRILPYGEEGRIVITSLYNKAHPFIRYDLGDIGVLSKDSTPQKPILKKLVGRTNDIAILPSGKKAAGLTFYYITKSIIEDDGNVKEFVIEQLTKDTFEIKYVCAIDLIPSQISKVEMAIAQYLEPHLKLLFTRTSVLDRTQMGKLKQFQSRL